MTFDAEFNTGTKALGHTGMKRMKAFSEWASHRPEDVVVAIGHSLYIRSFFRVRKVTIDAAIRTVVLRVFFFFFNRRRESQFMLLRLLSRCLAWLLLFDFNLDFPVDAGDSTVHHGDAVTLGNASVPPASRVCLALDGGAHPDSVNPISLSLSLL